MTTRAVILLAFIAGTFATGGIKKQLGQANARNLAQNNGGNGLGQGGDISGCDLSNLGQIPEITLPECPCNFTELPGLSSGVNTGFSQEALALQ
jgi:hypothetical protein